ncbi:MAG: 5-amino-6-(D-ribitylamino)uracil--L-tyrosine 4-hydroxyphenyl transferase CofH [Proteobacteria bacterium]|nr:5-amino-6-(D-ribitylamino)uracil--L-tyrosine 4-hydroxyphenyl transferase CofH [Pseudomonadota bacterium]
MKNHTTVIYKAAQGERLDPADALSLVDCNDLESLSQAAVSIRDREHPDIVSYSPKVFIPLTKLCRDVCHYCTFAETPKKMERAYLTAEQVLEIAQAGKNAGCNEALFTLGDKPELRYQSAREELHKLGHASTLSYLAEMAERVLKETGLLPHLNPGVMSRSDLLSLRRVSVSQGLMLESISKRLCEKGGPHYGSPDKHPVTRLGSIADAGGARVPFTSGILIGIGETRKERIESLLALRDLHEADGHIQEIIIQNFRRKPGTRMHDAPEPDLDDLLWTIAIARLIFGSHMNIQAPPNLMPEALPQLINAGINDWGGISPVTPDHVNPEAAWPHLDKLRAATEMTGKQLVARLPLYPEYVHELGRWVEPELHKRILNKSDAEGYARTDDWFAGSARTVPFLRTAKQASIIKSQLLKSDISHLVDQSLGGKSLSGKDIVMLFSARGYDFELVCQAADELRAEVNGDTVTYVVNRNINYTNICYFACRFCAFSKGQVSDHLRERGYNLSLTDIQKLVHDAWSKGATEVCLQGGIHPEYTGETYLSIARAVKQAQPDVHIHAFSPLEISHGAETLGMSIRDYLTELKKAGLSTLPGTAAEILDDEIRAIICPDKLNTAQWLNVIKTAHETGLSTTATIMFGHVDNPIHWARHLLRIKELQQETGGFTEFVPLPYVHMSAPLSRKGRARPGPTFRENLLMHAVARLVFYTHIDNIQASWVKLGKDGVKACLDAGVNDLGGTLMYESISRSAGAVHGQEFSTEDMCRLILDCHKVPRQRTTLYGQIGTKAGFSDRAVALTV